MSDPNCPYCYGAGEVSSVVDDVMFVFQCPCAGGSDESVRWLLGWNDEDQPDEDPPTEDADPDWTI